MNILAPTFYRRGAKTIVAALTLLLCAACTDSQPTQTSLAPMPPPQTPPQCDFKDLRFNSDYSTGRMDGCSQSGPASYVLTMSPENTPINHSPWYSFKIDSDDEKSITVTLQYTEHVHRYVPKLSSDGKIWAPVPERDIHILEGGKKAQLSLNVGPAPLWVSAQEIFDNDQYLAWEEQLEQLPYVQRSLMGKSVEGRDIFKLEAVQANQKKYVFFVGRQHPPEVTGALAMVPYIERLLAQDELATEFRRQFGILIVPNLNPDGVFHGNWRHNVNGIDLNRDWGPFTQPETQLMRDELNRFLAEDAPRPYLFLDFHSTANDVLYTQLPEMKTFPLNFTDEWMSAMTVRANTEFPGYSINPKPGHNIDEPTSKNYVYDTFGIPAITFELGDETDREFIKAYSTMAAEEMMKTLLASPAS